MAKIRSITVNFNAGTAKFGQDVDKASAKVREFGGHTVSSMQASSAAIRTLEGNFTNNLRAVERFMATTLRMGPVLQAAFPVVGAIAFGGAVFEIGKKVHEFFKEMKNAGETIAGSFRQATGGMRLTNDELRVSIDRLNNDIAKLEGHKQNTLKLALDEAKASADRLATSLEKDLEGLHKLVNENAIGKFRSFWTNEGTTQDIAKRLGGETGFGGFTGEIDAKTRAGSQAVRNAKTIKDADAAAAQLAATLNGAFDAQIAEFRRQLADAQEQAKPHVIATKGALVDTGSKNETARIEALTASVAYLSERRDQIPLMVEQARGTRKKEELEASKENQTQDRPFEKYITEARAKVAALRAQMEAIGRGEAAEIAAKSFGAAAEAIAKIREELKRRNVALTEGQAAQVRDVTLTMAQTEAASQWASKVAATNQQTSDRIHSQEMLTAAIGAGYEATKAANVETRLMAELGQHYGDAAFMQQHSTEIAGQRIGFGQEFDAQHGEQAGQALQKLAEQTALEARLAQVVSQGAEAVRQVQLAQKLQIIARDNSAASAKRLMAAEIELYNAERKNVNAGDVAKTIEKAQATERLAAATVKGAAALRQAGLDNQLQEIQRDGPASTRGSAAIMESNAAYSLELAQTAARANRLQSINDEIAKLKDAKATIGDTLGLEIALRDLENQRLDQLVKESLSLDGAKDGVRAFFLEMRKDAESAAEIIYKALNSSVDRVSGNLAKMMTQKPPKGGWGQEWAKSFQDVGGSMAQSGIKSLLQTGLGKLGIGGKPDGSSGNPLWVRMAGMPALAAAGGGGIAGGAKGIFSTIKHMFGFGGGPQAGDVSPAEGANPLDWGGFMADGGPVSPSSAYIVGENGPEILAGASGRVISNGEAARVAFGGGGVTFTNHIDARGADLGAYNRIQRGVEISSRAAAATAIQGMAERAKRVPR